jgi:hypothetical protein
MKKVLVPVVRACKSSLATIHCIQPMMVAQQLYRLRSTYQPRYRTRHICTNLLPLRFFVLPPLFSYIIISQVSCWIQRYHPYSQYVSDPIHSKFICKRNQTSDLHVRKPTAVCPSYHLLLISPNRKKKCATSGPKSLHFILRID